MNKLLFVCIVASLSSCNCKKEYKAPALALAAFMPTTAGNTWNYSTQSYSPTPSTGNYTLKATSKDTVVNGKTYRVFTNSSGGNDYYNQTGSDYYQYGNLAALNLQLELLYFKDATTGTKWSETKLINLPGVPTPFNVPLNYEITETGINYTVGTKTFASVTHVRMTIGAIVVMGLTIIPDSDFNYYYARSIGRIYSRTKLIINAPLAGININMDDEVKLTNYTIL